MIAMDLDKQVQLLIDNAPQDGVMPRVIVAISPVLKLLAAKLRHQYYILQHLDNSWVSTVLSRTNPDIEKRVIYAYPALQDILGVSDPQVIAVPLPVTHILFQLLALETVDNIVFFESGDSTTGIEVRREDMQNLIQAQLKQKLSNQLPPDIA